MTTRATPYARLGDHLAAQPPRVDRVTLPFAAIEALLGRPLPPTARDPGWRGRNWWTRPDGQHYAWDGWVTVGWEVAAVDRAAETVTFARRWAR